MKELLILHTIALTMGYLADLLIGDPHGIPHPIVAIGRLISALEHRLLKRAAGDRKKELRYGALMCLTVTSASLFTTIAILITAYKLHPYLGVAVEAVLTCYILAAKSLYNESMKVYRCLPDSNGLVPARRALSMIVGRDTDSLNREEITKACVETIAENTSDGVIAPLLYTAVGGPALGMLYKSVNTLDSMVGYRNEKY
jgi:adenosylcobinamide-phosphate synthase